MQMEINLVSQLGRKYQLIVEPDSSIANVKDQLFQKFRIHSDRINLYLKDIPEKLDEEQSIQDYHIKNNSTLQIVPKNFNINMKMNRINQNNEKDNNNAKSFIEMPSRSILPPRNNHKFVVPNQDYLKILTGMGMELTKCIRALTLAENNIDLAIEYILDENKYINRSNEVNKISQNNNNKQKALSTPTLRNIQKINMQKEGIDEASLLQVMLLYNFSESQALMCLNSNKA